MGQGQAPLQAYETAKNTAAALLAGNMNATILASVNRVFLESCMAVLQTVNPQFYRLGGGREEPDGSVSFLVRFVGREQGITGELFVRLEELRVEQRPADIPVPLDIPTPVDEYQINEAEDNDPADDSGEQIEQTEQIELITEPVQEPPQNVPAQKVWIFEDLIFEEPRTREAENSETRHRFDFPPYERFF